MFDVRLVSRLKSRVINDLRMVCAARIRDRRDIQLPGSSRWQRCKVGLPLEITNGSRIVEELDRRVGSDRTGWIQLRPLSHIEL